MIEYRVTKYDPGFRNARGVYTHDEWHMYSQVGEIFDGVELSREEYERVEAAYLNSAKAFLSESGIDALAIEMLENTKNHQPLAYTLVEGQALGGRQLRLAMRDVLRERIWCRFEAGTDGFVHFGWDYYMYIGVPSDCQNAIKFAQDQGLFVERVASPYKGRCHSNTQKK